MRVLHLINKLTEEQGFPPTRREIQTALDQKSPAGVQRHIKLLVDAKLMVLGERNTSRNIRITPHGFIALSVFRGR